MADEQIKDYQVDKYGYKKVDNKANWKGNIMKTSLSLLKVILYKMTTTEDFAKGTKAHVKSVLTQSSVKITEDQREKEVFEEDLMTNKSCVNSDTILMSKDQYSDNLRIKQREDTQNRKLGLLKNQRYWEDKGYEADYLLITTIYPIYF